MPSPLASPLLDYLADRRDAMVALVERLANVESPSHDPAAQQPVLGLLAEALDDRGYRPRRIRGRASGGSLLGVPRERRRGGVALWLCRCWQLAGQCSARADAQRI